MKKIALFALISAVAVSASASELWWFIDDTKVDDKAVDWTQVQLYASDNGYNYGGEKVGPAISKDAILADIESYGNTWTYLGDSSATSFYLELMDADGNDLGRSSVGANQGSIDAAQYIWNGAMSTPSAYKFTNFTTAQVIPEPTTGLLMLVGLAGLALKRRRA